jgi:hypothetical protein
LQDETFFEYLKRALTIKTKKDRLDKVLVEFDELITIAPFVQPIVAMDVNRVPKPLINAAGVFPVTEASAAGLYSLTTFMPDTLLAGLPTINALVAGYNVLVANAKRRIGRAVIAADGAGAFVATVCVPALAGSYGVMKLVSVKADAIVPAGVLIFESPAATPALPSVEVMPALAANVRHDKPDGIVITHAALTDNQAVTVRGTSWGALTNISIEYVYWYET